jgi:hypothetical protein
MSTTIDAAATTTDAVDRFLAAVEGAAVTADLYAPGARLDAVVPGWRFELEGGEAIAAEYAKWFAHPGSLEEVTRHAIPAGEVVEYTVTWEEDGVPHAARHIHVLAVDAAGLICGDHVWCGGRWPSTLLAEMEAARHDG